jgi:hypothetical protein
MADRVWGISVDPLGWRGWGKVVVAAQLATAGAYCYLAFHGASSGYAIALLGAAAAVMTLREEPNVGEKTVWVLIIFCLLIMELIAISNDHARDDAHFTLLVNQGLEISRKMTAMERSSSDLQESLNHQPSKAHSSTQQPTGSLSWKTGFVSIESSASRTGQMFVNVGCVNTSQVDVNSVSCAAALFVHDGASQSLTQQIEEKYFQEFLTDYHKAPPQAKATTAPQRYSWSTAWGPVMTTDLFNDLNNNRKVLVLVGQLSYKDSTGRHSRDLCEWLQPPINTVTPIWDYCHVHN